MPYENYDVAEVLMIRIKLAFMFWCHGIIRRYKDGLKVCTVLRERIKRKRWDALTHFPTRLGFPCCYICILSSKYLYAKI